MDKDSIFTGIIVGILVPVIGYFVIEQIFSILMSMGLMEQISGSAVGRRLRTLTLLAICCNLIPFNIARRRILDRTLRGIVFPTVAYVAFWVWKFQEVLFML